MEIWHFLGLALISYFSTIAAIIVGERLSGRVGLVDMPCERKLHTGDVPLIGGVAIFIGITVAVIVASQWLGMYVNGMFIGLSAAVLLIGLADDKWKLSPYSRFLLYGVIGMAMVWGTDVRLDSLGGLFEGRTVHLGMFALPFTVFVVVGGINAMNMVDGLDGLAGSLAFITLFFVCLAKISAGNADDLLLLCMLLSGIAGFLTFNIRVPGRSRARVFLGDAGSTFLGFAITWFLISSTQGTERAMPPVLALWLFALPLMDTVVLIFRRIARGDSPFTPGHDHLHHLLLQNGFSTNQVLGVCVGLHAGMALGGLMLWQAVVPEWVMFVLFLTIFFLYWMFHLLLAGHVCKVRTLAPASKKGMEKSSMPIALATARRLRVVKDDGVERIEITQKKTKVS